jgi:hypothetical protein
LDIVLIIVLLYFFVLRFIGSGTVSSFGIVTKSYYMIYGKTVKEEMERGRSRRPYPWERGCRCWGRSPAPSIRWRRRWRRGRVVRSGDVEDGGDFPSLAAPLKDRIGECRWGMAAEGEPRT